MFRTLILAALAGLTLLPGCQETVPIKDLCTSPPVTTTDAEAQDVGTSSTDTVMSGETGDADVPLAGVGSGNTGTSGYCKPCGSDADCIVGGNPCCNAEHRYYCYHKDLPVGFCDATCSLVPEKPGDERCHCIDGYCKGG